MADKRKLEQIPPAKTGVKLKNPKPKSPPPKEKARVISDVAPDVPADKLPVASDEAIRIEAEALAANQDLLFYMREFNKLLSQSVLPENRSTKDKEYEQEITSKLTKAAVRVDNLEPGKGSLALSTFAVRQSLLLRDAGNKLAYEIQKLREEIKKPKGDSIDEAKKALLEQAEKLGLKISIED